MPASNIRNEQQNKLVRIIHDLQAKQSVHVRQTIAGVSTGKQDMRKPLADVMVTLQFGTARTT